jgi:60 kDa SS-A/Ro ribonucleoprotein
MSKFNDTVAPVFVSNYMGEKAVAYNPELELVTILLTSFVEDSYYEKAPDMLTRLKGVIATCDPEFVAKAAVYARRVFGMRSITHVVASELARYASGKHWSRAFYNSIVYRVDDMSEIISYHLKNNGKLTNAMKAGFAKAFGQFQEYNLAKYKSEGKSVKLVDVANLVHPKPNATNGDALKKLINGELKSFDTWEVEISKAGGDPAKAKEAWTHLISEGKLPIFALLRNLRNIMEQAPNTINDAMKILTDPKRIKDSLILPFRFLAAYQVIDALSNGIFEKEDTNKTQVLKGIEKAIIISIDNLPVLMGKTVILSDNSGSMGGDGGGASPVSALSNIKSADIANLFALMYWLKSDNTFVGLFGDKLISPKLDRSKGLFENFKTVNAQARECGQSTEAGIFTMFKNLIRDKIMVNTIVIFSDMQIGDACHWYGRTMEEGRGTFMDLFKAYKKINPDFRCYSIDLKGYGTTVFDGSVIKIAGWSEKIFDIMKYAEQDKNALINHIKAIQLK